MDTKEILIEVSSKYAELAQLTRKLIATKVSDVAAIGSLQDELNSKNSEIATLLANDSEAQTIAGTLSQDIAALIQEASIATPSDESAEPSEEVATEDPTPSEEVETTDDVIVGDTEA